MNPPAATPAVLDLASRRTYHFAGHENRVYEHIRIMTKTPETHATTIASSEPVATEVAVGANVVLKVKVSCSAECDLVGLPVVVTAPDGAASTGVLATFDGKANESGDIVMKAPTRLGTHALTIAFEPHASEGLYHDASPLPVVITTIPHATSLAVWDIPSPVVTGQRLEVKVGAKSTGNLELGDSEIEIHDGSGAVAARTRLQGTPWPGTSALYWTTVELTAPSEAGLSAWSVRFAADGLALPHDGSAAEFSVAIVAPPEHRLTVRVVEKESRAPIDDVQVRLGAYRAATDPSGVAQVMMPKGAFDLHIWKAGYEAPDRTVEIVDDVSVEVEATIVPEEDPDVAWRM